MFRQRPACDVLRKYRVVSSQNVGQQRVSRRLTHMNWKHIVYATLAVLAGSSVFTINIAEAYRPYYYGGGFGDPFFYRTPYYWDAPRSYEPSDDPLYYDDGDCDWLQRNAVATGMRHWKDRYQECLRNRKK
jgi:hypothetical protein